MDRTEKFIEEELRRESERIERETCRDSRMVSEQVYDEMLDRIHRSIEKESTLQDDSDIILLSELEKCDSLEEAARLRDLFCQRIIDKYIRAVNRLTGKEN